MGLVANCLDKLVQSGQVSRAAADSALMIYEGAQGKLGREIPPDHADAAAALEAAKIMAEGARMKKLAYAKTAIAMRRIEDRAASHSKGPIAGFMSVLTRDIHGEGGMNVDSQAEVVFGSLNREAGKFVESFRSRMGGLKPQNHVGIRNAVLEMRGADTGDAVAKEAAGAMKAAIEKGFNRLQQAGVPVTRLDDWMTPQMWEGGRVRKFGRDEFISDITEELEAGRLEIIDRKAFGTANAMKAQAIIGRVFDDITIGKMSSGKTGGIKNYTRVFRFKDAESYARLMDKYGPGQGGYYGMMVGYLQSMSREIALAEILGPDHGAVAAHMAQVARKVEAGAKETRTVKLPFTQREVRIPGRGAFKPGLVEGSGAIERTYRYLSGQANAVEGEMMAGFFGALRAINTGAKLGSAVVTAVPGDLTTSAFASAHVGMSPLRIIRGIAREAVSNREARRISERLNVVAHSVMDASLTSKRFEDEVAGDGAFQRMASTVLRVTGLSGWTDMLKRVYTMELMGFIAEQSRKGWDGLEPKFRDFLQSHTFTPDEWDQLRVAPQFEVGKAKFFDIDAIESRELADRLLGAVIDERHFAVIEPDARVRGVTTAGAARGTLYGELARSSFMFKSFGMSIILTHVKRAASQGPMHVRAWRLAQFVTAMALAGGIALQLRSPIKGQDFRDPRDPDFLLESFFYGGGAGIYGDLLHSAQARGGVTGAAVVGGPAVELGSDVIGMPFETYRRWNNGQDQQWGKRMAGFMSRYMPGSSAWYARLAIDRYIYDQIEALLDPDYFRSFEREADRLRKRSGQEFFWAPGELAPERGPRVAPPAP